MGPSNYLAAMGKMVVDITTAPPLNPKPLPVHVHGPASQQQIIA